MIRPVGDDDAVVDSAQRQYRLDFILQNGGRLLRAAIGVDKKQQSFRPVKS